MTDTIKNPTQHTSSQRAVAYIEPNRLTFYRSDVGLKKMDITPDIIRDMEVLRKEKLPETIKAFMTQQSVLPGPMSLVVTDYFMFTKSFTNEGDQEKQNAIKADYLSNVPFEKVAHTEISTSTSTVVIATNEDLCLIFTRAFEGLGYKVENALPATVFTQIKVAPTGPDETVMQQFLQHIEENKKYNLIAEHRNKMVAHGHQKDQEKAKKIEAKRLPILIGFFGLMLVILVVVISSSQATSNKPQTTKVKAETIQPTHQPVVTEIVATPSATLSLNRQSMTLRIVASASEQSKADALRATLVDAGYTNVELVATSSALRQSIVQIKDSLVGSVKEQLLKEMRDITKATLFEEVSNSSFDATVQLSQ